MIVAEWEDTRRVRALDFEFRSGMLCGTIYLSQEEYRDAVLHGVRHLAPADSSPPRQGMLKSRRRSLRKRGGFRVNIPRDSTRTFICHSPRVGGELHISIEWAWSISVISRMYLEGIPSRNVVEVAQSVMLEQTGLAAAKTSDRGDFC